MPLNGASGRGGAHGMGYRVTVPPALSEVVVLWGSPATASGPPYVNERRATYGGEHIDFRNVVRPLRFIEASDDQPPVDR